MNITSRMASPMVSPMVLGMIGAGLLPTPLCFMPLIDDLSLSPGVGTATFTRSTTGTFDNDSTGFVDTAAIDVARFETEGVLIEGGSTNEALHSRDFTNAVHLKTNITPAMDATGADGVGSSASTLTATAALGTVFQTITKASAENTYSIEVRRKTGSGVIEISDDGGSTYTDITSSINNSTYSRFEITTTQANPSIGLRITTSGDEVEVDYQQLEALPFASSRIPTTTTTVTRTSDDLSIDAANIPTSELPYTVSVTVTPLGNVNVDTYFHVAGESNRTYRSREAGGTKTRSFNGGASEAVDGAAITSETTFSNVATGSNFELFQNAVSQGSISYAPVIGTKTSIALGNQNGGQRFYGHMKNLRIDSVALTEEQVATL